MKSNAFYFRLFMVILMFSVSALLYSSLPDIIPTHWNIEGQADDWGSKTWAAWLMPGISLIFLFLFPLLAKIDPKRKNYSQFSKAFEVIQTVIIGMMSFIFFLQYYMILKPENSELMGPLILSIVGISFVLLGNYMGKVRQNYFVGLRTPWTLNDPEVWQKSQRVSGWLFVIGGIVFLLEAWLQIGFSIVFTSTIIAMVVIPTVYSYVLYRRKNPK